jgi:hypothetical protein
MSVKLLMSVGSLSSVIIYLWFNKTSSPHVLDVILNGAMTATFNEDVVGTQ